MNEKGYSAETKKTILQRAAELVQKIFDKIKELLRDAQLSSVARDFAEAQADEAARLRAMFLDALDGMKVREQDTGNRAQGEKFSIKRSTEGFKYVQIDRSLLDISGNTKESVAIAKLLDEQFHNIIQANGQLFRINATTNGEFRQSNYSRYLFNKERQVYDDRIKSLENADEILMAATDWVEEKIKHKKFDHATRGFVYLKVDDRGYKAEVVVGLMNDGSATYYSLEKMKEKTIVEAPLSREPKRRPSSEVTSTKDSIPQTGENVNTEKDQHSLRLAEGTPSVASGASSVTSAEEQMDKLRLSLGLEAQNSRLTQKLGDYQQIIRQQDTEIRELQRLRKTRPATGQRYEPNSPFSIFHSPFKKAPNGRFFVCQSSKISSIV